MNSTVYSAPYSEEDVRAIPCPLPDSVPLWKDDGGLTGQKILRQACTHLLPKLKIADVLTPVLFMEFVLVWPELLKASLLSRGMDVAWEVLEGAMLP